MDLERYYLLITPRSSPLHLTPWVPDADQLNQPVLIMNLGEKTTVGDVVCIKLKIKKSLPWTA